VNLKPWHAFLCRLDKVAKRDFMKTKVCFACNGSGIKTCPQCGGGGISQLNSDLQISGTSEVSNGVNTCPKCGGSGQITCPACDGTGEVTEEELLQE